MAGGGDDGDGGSLALVPLTVNSVYVVSTDS